MTETLPDSAPCGYFSFSDDGTIDSCNRYFCNHLNYVPEQLTGKNVESIFTLPTRIFYQTHFFPLLKMHGHAEEIFITLLAADGSNIPVLLNAARIKSGEKFITTCAFIIVNNRKKYEDELINARKSAEQALKDNADLLEAQSNLREQAEKLEHRIRTINKQNEDLRQMNHVVTHNLKEPVRKILIYGGKLQQQENSPDTDKLLKASIQLKSVVSGLQEFVWLDDHPVTFAPVSLENILKQVEGEIIKLHHDLIINITSTGLPVADADAEQIRMMFYQILLNAVKFRKGNDVQVTVTHTLLKQNYFKVLENKYKYEDFVKIEIRDEGQGFSAEFRDVIFDLFRKVHYETGRGVGLALCRKVAENHFGKIEASGVENEFTVITIWLPLKQ